MNQLKRRCVDISFRHKLTHVSSVLNTVDVIDEIYGLKKPEDPFVLGNSHASLALFVVLEKRGICDAEEMMLRHGTHACMDRQHDVWVSGGSLGQAETVAVGLSLADPDSTVWLVTSDGACMEGAVYEAMRTARLMYAKVNVTVVFNGFGAYGEIKESEVRRVVGPKATIHHVDQSEYPEWLKGLPGHYLVLNESQRDELMA